MDEFLALSDAKVRLVDLRKQEEFGKTVGGTDYSRREELAFEDGLAMPPHNWPGYDGDPTVPVPEPIRHSGPGARESKLQQIAFDTSLSPRARRRKVQRHLRRLGQPQFASGEVRRRAA